MGAVPLISQRRATQRVSAAKENSMTATAIFISMLPRKVRLVGRVISQRTANSVAKPMPRLSMKRMVAKGTVLYSRSARVCTPEGSELPPFLC